MPSHFLVLWPQIRHNKAAEIEMFISILITIEGCSRVEILTALNVLAMAAIMNDKTTPGPVKEKRCHLVREAP